MHLEEIKMNKQNKLIENVIRTSFSNMRLPLMTTLVSRFDFFNVLNSKKSWTFEEISSNFGMNYEKLDSVITVCKSEGIIKQKGQKYYLTEAAANNLTNKGEYNLSSLYLMRLHQPTERSMVDSMENCLRDGTKIICSPATLWDEDKRKTKDSKEAQDFTKSMNDRGQYLAKFLSAKVNLEKYSKLLDLGGASGVYSSEFCKKYDIEADVLELPAVTSTTKKYISLRNDSRVGVVEGDMFKSIPKNYDVHLYSNVMHDWKLDEIEHLLNKSYNTLNDGGKVIIHDKFLNNEKSGPRDAVDHSLVLAAYTEGRCYSRKEIKERLNKIGFKNIEYISTTCGYGAIIGQKLI
jgi:3-hydroxy-5-methyl-1-naphthoate 3-O-methyltransferase